METRHLTMISLGGVIGTGLFLSSGYTIHQAGPLGAIIAYASVRCSSTYHAEPRRAVCGHAVRRQLPPVCEAFHRPRHRVHHRRAVLAELGGGARLRIHRRGPADATLVPAFAAWVWSAAFIVVVFLLNILSVRLYGESEFWFASIKVFAIIAFIIIGLLAMFGAIPIAGYDHAPMFENFYSDGWLPNGVLPIFSTLLTVVFAFSGTEVVGVAAGETKDPSKAIPKAVHTTVLRLAIFFIGSIAVMAALIPWHKSGVDASPFVLVFQSIGMPFAGDIMNFVVLTAVLSAANSGLYVCSRMVWSLAQEGMIPRVLAKTNFHGVPVCAVMFSMAGSLLALLSSVVAASTVYLALVAVSGLATLVCGRRFPSATCDSATNGSRRDIRLASSSTARLATLRADRRDCDVRRRAGSGDLRSVAALHAAVHDSVRGAVLHGLLRVRGVACETAWRAGRCSERLAKRSAGRIATPS